MKTVHLCVLSRYLFNFMCIHETWQYVLGRHKTFGVTRFEMQMSINKREIAGLIFTHFIYKSLHESHIALIKSEVFKCGAS